MLNYIISCLYIHNKTFPSKTEKYFMVSSSYRKSVFLRDLFKFFLEISLYIIIIIIIIFNI